MDKKQVANQLRGSIEKGDIEAVRAALKANKGLFEADTPFGTWLHVAASAGQVEVAKLLVSMGADVNAVGGMSDGTPLLEAASEGHTEAVEYLLSCGATLDVTTSEQNPLLAAIQGEHVSVVKALIDAGIDTKIKYSGQSVKNMDALAFAREYGNADIIKLLSPSGTPKNTKKK